MNNMIEPNKFHNIFHFKHLFIKTLIMNNYTQIYFQNKFQKRKVLTFELYTSIIV